MSDDVVAMNGIVRERVAQHWIARLRRSSAMDAIDQAVNAGLLDRVERRNGTAFFRLGSKIARWTATQVRSLLRHTFGRGVLPGHEEPSGFGFDDAGDDTLSIDEVMAGCDAADRDNDRRVRSKGTRAKLTGSAARAKPVLTADAGSVSETIAVDVADSRGKGFEGDEATLNGGGDQPDVASILEQAARGGPASPSLRSSSRERLDRMALMRLVRTQASPPTATPVATLLLLAEAVARSGHDVEEVLAILRRPKPVVAIIGSVVGFETAFLNLLRYGEVLPGRSAFMDGYDLQSSRDLRSADGSRRHLVVFKGTRADLAEDEAAVDRQVGRAIQHPYPLLAVADRADDLPEVLLEAADLRLDCSPVSLRLIVDTMKIVLGRRARKITLDSLTSMNLRSTEPGSANVGTARGAPAGSTMSKRISSASPSATQGQPAGREGSLPLDGCELLTLADLALAIRPGMRPRRCVELLRDLIARRRRKATSARPATKAGSGSTKHGASSSRRDRVGSGTTIIQPEPVAQDGLGTAAGKTPLRLESLSGYGPAGSWAIDLRDDLPLWRDGKVPWSDLSTRLLISGPPGTGKTTFARALGNTLRIPLLATSVSTWLEPSHLGDVLARMAAAFDEAQQHAPCILFVDEIDGIGCRGRSRSYDDYWTSVVNRALELLDGAVKTEGVVLVGATNHPEAIDPALLRSGRLETRIDIPMPDVDALTGILRHHLGADAAAVIATAGTAADNPLDQVPGRLMRGDGQSQSGARRRPRPRTAPKPSRSAAPGKGLPTALRELVQRLAAAWTHVAGAVRWGRNARATGDYKLAPGKPVPSRRPGGSAGPASEDDEEAAPPSATGDEPAKPLTPARTTEAQHGQ